MTTTPDVTTPPAASPGAPTPQESLPPCERCGTFAPLSYKFEAGLCASCIERTVHPIQATELTVGSVLHGVWMLVRAVGPFALLVTIGVSLPRALLSLVWEPPLIVDTLYNFFVLFMAEMVIAHAAYQLISRRGQWSAADAFRGVGRRYGDLMLTNFVQGLLTGLLTLLFIIPGLVMSIAWCIAPMMALLEGQVGQSALSASSRRTKGHRWSIFGAFAVLVTPLLVPLALGIVAALLSAFLLSTATAPDANPLIPRLLAAGVDFAIPLSLLPLRLGTVVVYAKLESRS